MILICFDDTFVSFHRPGGQSGLSGHSSCSTDDDPSSWFEQSPSAPSSGNIGRQLLVLCLQPVPQVTEHGSQSVQAVQLPGFPMSVNKQTHKFQSFLVMSGDEIMFFPTQYCGVNLPARFPLATDTVSSGHDLHTHGNSYLQQVLWLLPSYMSLPFSQWSSKRSVTYILHSCPH